MKVGFGGLTENIVYVRRLSDDPRRVPAERFGRCQWGGGGGKPPRKSLEESLDQLRTKFKVSRGERENSSTQPVPATDLPHFNRRPSGEVRERAAGKS